MEYRIQLSPKEILRKKFTKDVKGYRAGEVDAFLDVVMADYEAFAGYRKAMEEHLAELEARLTELSKGDETSDAERRELRKSLKELEIENAGLKARLENIKPSDSPSEENLQYIQRINALENALYSIGIDPNKVINGQ